MSNNKLPELEKLIDSENIKSVLLSLKLSLNLNDQDFRSFFEFLIMKNTQKNFSNSRGFWYKNNNVGTKIGYLTTYANIRNITYDDTLFSTNEDVSDHMYSYIIDDEAPHVSLPKMFNRLSNFPKSDPILLKLMMKVYNTKSDLDVCKEVISSLIETITNNYTK